MTIKRLYEIGTVVALLDSKEHPGKLARIYAACESRGYRTKYLQKLFFWFVPLNEYGMPLSITGVSRNARRKNITQFSNVTILDAKLRDKFIA